MDFPLLIFTDLDGTLLDHHSYSYTGAEAALKRLRQHAIPIILNSSKTRAELEALQAKLGLHGPFIAENGGGLFIPADYAVPDPGLFESLAGCQGKRFGRPYNYIRKIFASLRSRFHVRGFGDMVLEELMEATGLSRADALLACQRDFSEPFLFQGEPLMEELKEEVAGHGLTVTRGGRFYHLMAAEQDKGRATAETTRLFQAGCPEKIVTIGLGDAENDYPMLKAVDIPVLLSKPDGGYADLHLANLRRSLHPGSRGWGAAVTAILNDFHLASPYCECSHSH